MKIALFVLLISMAIVVFIGYIFDYITELEEIIAQNKLNEFKKERRIEKRLEAIKEKIKNV